MYAYSSAARESLVALHSLWARNSLANIAYWMGQARTLRAAGQPYAHLVGYARLEMAAARRSLESVTRLQAGAR